MVTKCWHGHPGDCWQCERDRRGREYEAMRREKKTPLPCVYRGRVLEPCPRNDPRKHVYECLCETHDVDRCTILPSGIHDCQHCIHRAEVLPPPDTTVRHLAYFVYPVAGNGIWQLSIDRLKRRLPLFNGRRLVAIATTNGMHDLDAPGAVTDRLGGDCEYLVVPHRKSADGRGLGEVVGFLPMLKRLADCNGPDDVLFYGHTKGATQPVNDGVTVHRWADLMYRVNLDHWPRVRAALEAKHAVGAFRRQFRWFRRRSRFHYHGTFFWVRLAEAFKRRWRKVPQFYGGVEAWPGVVFQPSESACLFGERFQCLYLMDQITAAEAAYAEWVKT